MKSRQGNGRPTQIADREDTREAIELSSTENADLCEGCVKCCTYITIEVDKPRQAWEYDQWIWTIDHHGIEMYLEKPETWNIHVNTRCDHLKDDGRCRIYGSHPVLCREYDPRECERRYPLSGTVAWFHNGAELAAWIEKHRPVHYQRLLEYRGGSAPGWPGDRRRKLHAASLKQGRSKGNGGQLIPISVLATSLAGQASNRRAANGRASGRKAAGRKAAAGRAAAGKRASSRPRPSVSSTRR